MKKFVSLLCAGSLLASASAYAAQLPANWSESTQRIVSQTADESRSPISRLEFAQMILPVVEQYTGSDMESLLAMNGLIPQDFTDCSDPAAAQAQALGLVNGYEDGTFRPDGRITRAEAAQVLHNTARLLTGTQGGPTTGNWAQDALAAVQSMGIMIGDGTGDLMPNLQFTNGDCAITIQRLCALLGIQRPGSNGSQNNGSDQNNGGSQNNGGNQNNGSDQNNDGDQNNGGNQNNGGGQNSGGNQNNGGDQNNGGGQQPGDTDAVRAELLRLVNEARAQQGLSALGTTAALTDAAQTRAEELSTLYSHTRPDGTQCFTVLGEKGVTYRTAGENIATGYSSAQQVFDGWMNSSGHRQNIMNSSFTHIGIGYTAQRGWVQLFIG